MVAPERLATLSPMDRDDALTPDRDALSDREAAVDRDDLAVDEDGVGGAGRENRKCKQTQPSCQKGSVTGRTRNDCSASLLAGHLIITGHTDTL